MTDTLFIFRWAGRELDALVTSDINELQKIFPRQDDNEIYIGSELKMPESEFDNDFMKDAEVVAIKAGVNFSPSHYPSNDRRGSDLHHLTSVTISIKELSRRK